MAERLKVFEPEWFWDGSQRPPVQGKRLVVRGAAVERILDGASSIDSHPERIALPGMLLTPGLCNWHTHLELSAVQRPAYKGSFVDWLMMVMGRGPKSSAEAASAAIAGAKESLTTGVTEVVDISRNPHEVRTALATTGLIVRSCGEITGLGFRKQNGVPMLAAALEESAPANGITRGISPHAPYSTDGDWYAAAAAKSRDPVLTFTTHLCETQEEREFLSTHQGPFRKLWDAIGGWDSSVPRFEGGPVRWLDSIGALQGANLIAAHCNDVTDEELNILARNNVTVVHCPRTHAYFQRARFDLDRYRQSGVKVRVGTDSKASAPNLSVLEDLSLLAALNPQGSGEQIMSLGIGHELVPGASADMVAWTVDGEHGLRQLLQRPESKPQHVFVRGNEIAHEQT